MECIPRTREGGFQHVTSANGDRQGVRLNESEMWIDTLFMTVLFLNRMGQKYGKQEWIDESIKQVLMHIKYLYDTHTGLFFHGWSFNRMDNFGGVFWCRGNSWFTLGILDYLDIAVICGFNRKFYKQSNSQRPVCDMQFTVVANESNRELRWQGASYSGTHPVFVLYLIF